MTEKKSGRTKDYDYDTAWSTCTDKDEDLAKVAAFSLSFSIFFFPPPPPRNKPLYALLLIDLFLIEALNRIVIAQLSSLGPSDKT